MKKCRDCETTNDLYVARNHGKLVVYNQCRNCRIKKISNTLKELWKDEDYAKRQCESHKGKKLTKESIIKREETRKRNGTNKCSIECRKKISKKLLGNTNGKGHVVSEKNRRIVGEASLKRIFNSNYGKDFKYKDIYMRSSWEVKVASWLDSQKIKWKYESKECRFKLSNNHYYIIDFYLPKLNKYIEVKGYWNETSKIKYNEASKKLNLVVIDGRNINNINLNTRGYV